ncbi:unnamed protein product [Rotaria sp. Silwood2]|nr:unnamed protein product [Rotaria sp. Silwood2]CAF2687263.1 unnamed protein product [Rotaria sp. Silwood2]CAF2975972.1 unnamed protein product [Rotaria sp. Silwood2]CAF3081165.1 unnamed protein product [Rotaria sp. Silwood2]CAF3926905.1 unnamed protein product [Rotaria sp. Silwood2]
MIQNTTAKDETAENNYDDTGAMIYIIIVLLWYSVGIIFMLGMQMKARSEIIEESARRRTKLLIRNLRDHTNTKEILEELVDKQKRARLWEIYLGTKDHTRDKLSAETARIRNIEKRLASIKGDHRLTNETLFPSGKGKLYLRSRSDSRQMTAQLSVIEEPSTLRRRSSFDQQTLERWKALANQSKTHEQMPWTIRKLMIRRYFRRLTKRPLPIIRQDSSITNPITDDLLSFTNQINILTQHHSELNLDELSTCDERQNPYLTYFFKPTSRPSILTSRLFPTLSEH